MIQHFLILKRTGQNIYKRDLGQLKVDETILSGFFSAFFSLSQSLFQADIQDIELGPYRMLFEFVGNELILTVLFDKSDSLINVHQRLIEIRNIVEVRYSHCLGNPHCTSEDFIGLSEIIEDVFLNTYTIDIGQKLREKYLKIMEKLNAKNEILDCALITIEGIPLIRMGRKEFLDLVKTQMDAFWKFNKLMLDEIILNHQKRYSIFYRLNDDLILCVFLRRDTPIQVASSIVKETAKKIAKLYPH